MLSTVLLACSGATTSASGTTGEDAGNPSGRVVIASGQGGPTGIAVDDTGIYFANREAGTIAWCPLAGCGKAAPKVLADNQDAPIAVAVGNGTLYWVTGWRDGDSGDPASRPMFRCDLPNCDAASIAPFDQGPNQPYGIALSGDRLYIAAWPQYGYCNAAGCTQGGAAFGGDPAVAVALSASSSFFAMYGHGYVVRCERDGCANRTTLVDGIRPLGVAVDADSLYVTDYEFIVFGADAGPKTGRLLRCPIAGCGSASPEVLASGAATPYGVAVYGDRVYFTSITEGLVLGIPK
jgi:hypothetical protein